MSVVNEILRVCASIDSPRTTKTIFNHLMSETDELYVELYGNVEGEDGVIGEAVDVILCAMDIIYKEKPNVIEADIMEVVKRKLDKWQRVYGRQDEKAI